MKAKGVRDDPWVQREQVWDSKEERERTEKRKRKKQRKTREERGTEDMSGNLAAGAEGLPRSK